MSDPRTIPSWALSLILIGKARPPRLRLPDSWTPPRLEPDER